MLAGGPSLSLPPLLPPPTALQAGFPRILCLPLPACLAALQAHSPPRCPHPYLPAPLLTLPCLSSLRLPIATPLQALEPSTLIALQLLAPRGRLVLVGDPQQLPATVVSRAAAAAALAQSLFERLMLAGYPVCMLRQQVGFLERTRRRTRLTLIAVVCMLLWCSA